MSRQLSAKKIKFCHAYVNGKDGRAAAIEAGYSPKSATSQASRMLATDEDVKAYIAELVEKMESEKIATAKEFHEFFTSVMRGEITEPRLVGVGQGVQTIQYTAPQTKDRIQAAKIGAELQNLFKQEEKQVETVTNVVDGSGLKTEEEEEDLED